jgi:transcriptional regulator with XRE-family HTH domain
METKTGNLLDELLASITPLEQSKVDTKMLLAAKIADGMKAKGWKNKDLLEAVGKENPSVITKWLSGTHNFTTDTLVELEDALDIKLLSLDEKKAELVWVYQISVGGNSEIPCYPYLSVKDPKLEAERGQIFSTRISDKQVLSNQNS